MSVALALPESSGRTIPGGFAGFDEAYHDPRFAPSLADLRRFGQFELVHAAILEPPPDVGAGNILTNPGEIMYLDSSGAHNHGQRKVTYGRHERRRLHLGTTIASPYLLEGVEEALATAAAGSNDIPTPWLNPYIDASQFVGEDLRTVYGIKRRLPISGRVIPGWLISTIIATPVVGKPADVDHVTQVFQWGENLNHMEIVAEVTDPNKIIEKNTLVAPGSDDPDDVSLHAILRPKPHIAYRHLKDADQLNDILNLEYTVLTKDFLQAVDAEKQLIHLGPNRFEVVRSPRGTLMFHINGHEAARDIVPDHQAVDGNKTILHYRTANYGAKLLVEESRGIRRYPAVRFLLLGDHIERGDLPDAPSKPPENGVLSYYDVDYGSMGRVAHGIGGLSAMVIGVSDTAMAFGIVRRVANVSRLPRERAGYRRHSSLAFALAA